MRGSVAPWVFLPILGLTIGLGGGQLACGPNGAANQGGASSSGSAATGPGGSGSTGGAAATTSTGVEETDAGTADADAMPPADPCPNLPVPPMCLNRSVVYREWGPAAVGDGVYFAGQAPLRLGFSRVHGAVWIVKFHVEANTYVGRVSGYGDSVGGTFWISDDPCNPTFAITNHTQVFTGQGGGGIDFVVTRDDVDAQKLHSDPMYGGKYDTLPQLRGDHCYYAVFENTDVPAGGVTADFLATTPDPCGSANDPTCKYLAFDFNHLLHDVTTGDTIGGNVLPGLSTP